MYNPRHAVLSPRDKDIQYDIVGLHGDASFNVYLLQTIIATLNQYSIYAAYDRITVYANNATLWTVSPPTTSDRIIPIDRTKRTTNVLVHVNRDPYSTYIVLRLQRH